jgi:hypothetical protein
MWWAGFKEEPKSDNVPSGARSMLCDPRERGRLVRVNMVKGREVWRPLAPSVLGVLG